MMGRPPGGTRHRTASRADAAVGAATSNAEWYYTSRPYRGGHATRNRYILAVALQGPPGSPDGPCRRAEGRQPCRVRRHGRARTDRRPRHAGIRLYACRRSGLVRPAGADSGAESGGGLLGAVHAPQQGWTHRRGQQAEPDKLLRRAHVVVGPADEPHYVEAPRGAVPGLAGAAVADSRAETGGGMTCRQVTRHDMPTWQTRHDMPTSNPARRADTAVRTAGLLFAPGPISPGGEIDAGTVRHAGPKPARRTDHPRMAGGAGRCKSVYHGRARAGGDWVSWSRLTGWSEVTEDA